MPETLPPCLAPFKPIVRPAPPRGRFFQADTALVEAVRARWGALDVLVNNAVSWPSAFTTVEETSLDAWCAPVHANVDGTFALIKAALPLLRASAAALAKELGPAGILTNVLMSGAVTTEARVRPPKLIAQLERSAATGRLTEADEVARAAVFLGSRANGHINGEAIRCDGFFVSGVRREM